MPELKNRGDLLFLGSLEITTWESREPGYYLKKVMNHELKLYFNNQNVNLKCQNQNKNSRNSFYFTTCEHETKAADVIGIIFFIKNGYFLPHKYTYLIPYNCSPKQIPRATKEIHETITIDRGEPVTERYSTCCL
jgi:hypothetical protein